MVASDERNEGRQATAGDSKSLFGGQVMCSTASRFNALLIIVFVTLSICSLVPGCSRSDQDAPAAQRPAPVADRPSGAVTGKQGPPGDVQEYVLKGEVRKVEKKEREVTLK